MPGEAIPGMKLGKGKEGSFRVASGEVVSNLAFLKLEGPGTFDGSQIEIGAQVVEIAKSLASEDEMFGIGMMIIMHCSGNRQAPQR